LLTSDSIVAVQGLGANPFYTWVKKVPADDYTALKRFKDRLFRKNNTVQGEDGKHDLKEVMWPRDLLVPLFKNARIATYSYKSDWKDRQVKTSLRECGQQLVEVLLQHRQDANVRRRANHYPASFVTDASAMTGTPKTTRLDWT
jgi:hypothetical protein